jgi:7-cyano-7-deazaguanine synthase
VDTVGFAYGQENANELLQRDTIFNALRRDFREWPGKLGSDRIVRLDLFGQLVKSSLLGDEGLPPRTDGLPVSFVPGRNVVFLTVAAIMAKEGGHDALVAGMCETDYEGYPDCRDDTIKSLQASLNLGLQARTSIETPLMYLDKGDTWKLAEQIGGKRLVNLIVNQSCTCYGGELTSMQPWGMGCGKCAACERRAKGWAKYTFKAEPTLEGEAS